MSRASQNRRGGFAPRGRGFGRGGGRGMRQRDGRVGPATYARSRAPANYVAGLGRGAAGFTTSMDVGPAQSADIDNGP